MRLTRFFRRRYWDEERARELEAYLEAETDENIARGMSPEEARYAAHRKLGNTTRIREEIYHMNSLGWIETLWQDLRFAVRMLHKSPGFTAVAVLTLALGIGANTAIFTVVNAVLLRPLPYPEPERIVRIALVYKGQLGWTEFSAKQFEFFKSHSDPLQYLAATVDVGFNLAGTGTPERIRALRVSKDYFRVFGANPRLGRDFLAEEDRIGGPNVAVLSCGLWVRNFGADPKVIGRIVELDGAPFTVIGAMPSGFQATSPVDLWTTIGQVANSMGHGGNYEVIGRLNPGVSRRQADSYMATLARPFLEEFDPEEVEKVAGQVTFGAIPYNDMLTYDVRRPLLVLFGAVGLVLLIACVNIANLQMARAEARTREIAVRTALGAGWRRVLRQLLTENLLLGLLGASLGLLLVQLGLHLLLGFTPTDLPHARNISLDRWAMGFTMLTALLTGVLFGIAPALQASRVNLSETLKEGGARGGSPRHRLGSALVEVEVGLSLVLLIGSGLLIETFTNLLRTSPGFDPHLVLSIPIWTTGTHFKSAGELARFYEVALSRISSIPGVDSVGAVAGGLPLEHGGNASGRLVGQKNSDKFWAEYREVSPDYFHTLGVPLRGGRFFTRDDSPNSPKIVIVNQAFARKYMPGQNPVAQYLSIDDVSREIVGIVGDVKTHMNEPALPTYFLPLAQASLSSHMFFEAWIPTCVLLRTSQSPSSLRHAVEGALRSADANVAIGEVRSMEQVLSFSIAFQRFLMTLMTIFAGLSLVLACVGLYGVISYSVSRRTRELGIRMALGATRPDILLAVIRQGLRLTLIGTAAGLVAAFGLSQALRSVLFGVKPSDPSTFVGASLLLVAVALLAGFIPARRATKIEPTVALRHE
jgi:predicted permease